ADGYAMASGIPAVVNVHTCCGLGNAMGMLYNAYQEGTPLLLTAGQQDRRLRLGEGVLEGDMVGVTRPWTKWSYEVPRADDMALAVRRAVKTALTPPTGPVFLSLPVDVQQEPVHRPDLAPPSVPSRRIRPPAEALRQAAELLSAGDNPAVLAGCRAAESGAVAEVVAVAERLGAAVYTESATSHGRLAIPSDHPQYAGPLPLWSPQIHACLAPHDVILVVGMDLLRLYIHQDPEQPLPAHARLVQLDCDPWQVAKNYPVDVALLGDPQAGLSELAAILQQTMSPERVARASDRRERLAARRAAEWQTLRSELDEQQATRPMTPLTFMHAVGRVLPAHAAVVEEAVTTHQHLHKRLGFLKDPTGHFAHRGWALGWGLGCAMGVKLAWPDRPVVALLGDGASLYGIQGLWTAAHYRIPVAFVIANNAQYKILKVCAGVMQLPQMMRGHCVGMDLVEPRVDFVTLAASFGVESHRVEDPEELSDRLRDWLSRPRPILFDVPLES
ncbi:MAG: thiamine pyrophosphate-dependent enzyme, partial [Planctomycetes bacterium]|nr:thiamine pyrophosphate-dependent enzyme [Planctomycetota bacterium]